MRRKGLDADAIERALSLHFGEEQAVKHEEHYSEQEEGGHLGQGCDPRASCAVLCCAVLCCAVLCCAVLCCAVLCCAVLCSPRPPPQCRLAAAPKSCRLTASVVVPLPQRCGVPWWLRRRGVLSWQLAWSRSSRGAGLLSGAAGLRGCAAAGLRGLRASNGRHCPPQGQAVALDGKQRAQLGGDEARAGGHWAEVEDSWDRGQLV